MQNETTSAGADRNGHRHARSLLKEALLRRLEGLGVETSVIPGVVRSLNGMYRYDRYLSTYEVNHRLKYLGWSEIELDHYTWQLAVDLFMEAAGGSLDGPLPS